MSSPSDRKRIGELLHQRLLSETDLTVTEEIAENFFLPLVQSLAREFPRLQDPSLIDAAAGDAILHLFDHPERFDPSRADLFTYLRVRARSQLLNRLRQEKNSVNKVVELRGAGAVFNVTGEPEFDVEADFAGREFQAGIIEQLRQVFIDPTDLGVLALMVEGERETKAFAQVLNITKLPADEQQRLVKKAKDRINKILDRKFRHRGKRR